MLSLQLNKNHNVMYDLVQFEIGADIQIYANLKSRSIDGIPYCK